MAGALQISSVVKTFGELRALDNVSLSINSGKFMSFLGPSGCGKTTLLRVIAGFETPDSGDVQLDGKSIINEPPYRRPIGMVFQNLALFPHLTVDGNLRFGLSVKRENRATSDKKVDHALALVGLEGLRGRRMHQLSGGQRQRVALARALITEPALLLLDEPLSALDMKLRRQLQVELKQLQSRTGTTFIFVTHDQDEAMAISDRIAVFREGIIEQVGSPQEIYRSPKNRFVAEFVGDTNIITAEIDDGEIMLPELGVKLPLSKSSPTENRFLLSFRPEHVVLSADPHPNKVAATIKEIDFGGMIVRIIANAHTSGKEIRIARPSDGAIDLRVGETVHLSFDIASSVQLPEN